MFFVSGTLFNNALSGGEPHLAAKNTDAKSLSTYTCSYSKQEINVPQINGWGWEYFRTSISYSYTYTAKVSVVRPHNPLVVTCTYDFLNFQTPYVNTNSQFVKESVSANGFDGLTTVVEYYENTATQMVTIISQQLSLKANIQMSGWMIQSLSANLCAASAADPNFNYVTGSYTLSHTVTFPKPSSFPVTLPIELS